ncbi:hypothetical protein L916_11597 [Phytophthora nicotianae]|uniref:Uncharacterized protein n=1 Tax=Phytophthora nicotianae TaxID=4792 RepID=W2IQM9_PHYNI|nr:hypothetical protein L916_11597 [Phytophthora nicotianae]
MGIDERKKVGILKDMIKEKNSYSLPFKEGVVTTAISDMMKNQMDPSYRVRNTDAYAPDEDAAEDAQRSSLHALPPRWNIPWILRSARCTGDKNIALWYDEDKTLCIHIKFEASKYISLMGLQSGCVDSSAAVVDDNALRFEMLFAKKD